ncbi:hypothetical protein ACMAUO_05745 [Gluconacetobacter sp. Hr-1-5]
MFAAGERKQFLRTLESDTTNDGFPKIVAYRRMDEATPLAVCNEVPA